MDHALRNSTVVGILAYVFFYGSRLEVHYPHRFIELYQKPWWRLLLVVLVALGSWWCPRVGLALALAVYLYLSDIHTLSSGFLNGEDK